MAEPNPNVRAVAPNFGLISEPTMEPVDPDTNIRVSRTLLPAAPPHNLPPLRPEFRRGPVTGALAGPGRASRRSGRFRVGCK